MAEWQTPTLILLAQSSTAAGGNIQFTNEGLTTHGFMTSVLRGTILS